MNLRPLPIVIIALVLLRSPARPIEHHRQCPGAVRWNTIEAVHVDIHVPSGMEELAIKTVEISEQSYVHLSNHLGHEMSRIIPVTIIPAGYDFPAPRSAVNPSGRCSPGETSRSYSIFVSFNGSYADLQQSLTGAMARVFLGSMAGNKPWKIAAFSSSRIPFWLAEGMVSYLSRGFDAAAEREIRELIRGGRLHGIRDLQEMDGAVYGEISAEGQALCHFLDRRFGKEILGELIRCFLDTNFYDDAFIAATGKNPDNLDHEWHAFLMAQYRKGGVRQRSVEGTPVIGAMPGLLIPSASPDGKKMAALRRRNRGYDLKLFDCTESIGLKIVRSKTLLTDAGCFGIEPAAADDNRISWTPDGRSICLAVRDQGRTSLAILDAKTGRVVLRRRLPFSALKDPSISPSGRFVAFSAVAGSAENIYIWEREKDTITRITDDDFSDRYPVFTDDGHILYATNWNAGGNPAHGDFRICMVETRTGRRSDLVTSEGRIIHLDLSPDGGKLLFVSDRSGLARLYLYAINAKTLSRLSIASEWAAHPRWYGGSDTFIFTGRTGESEEASVASVEGTALIDPSSREAPVYQMTYREPYADPGKYSFHPYHPCLNHGWLQLGAAGTMNRSSFCFLQTGITDMMGRQKFTLEANYAKDSPKHDIYASLAYEASIGRTVLGLGLFRQSNPLAIHSLGDMNASPSGQSFGIHGMEHYGGYCSAGVRPMGSIILSFSASSGRYEREYRYPDIRQDLHMTFGKISVAAEYDTRERGPVLPLRGTLIRILAEHAFDFTGNKSFTRLGIDLSHRFLFGRHFMVFLRGAGATLVGPNTGKFQHYLGGFSSLRGYDLNALSGKNMFLFNAELLFTPADWRGFGNPWRGGPGNIGFVLFFDAGSAWNGGYRLIDKKTGRLDDLKIDFGAGVRVAVTPLIILKLDFAWPFDNKTIKKTGMVFGVGFDY